MACRSLCILILDILLFPGPSEHTAANFPLNDCDTGQFDILVVELGLVTNKDSVYENPTSVEYIANIWAQENNASSRVRVLGVRVHWNNSAYACNVKLVGYDKDVIDICSMMKATPFINLTTRSMQADIEVKIKIAKIVFSSTHIRRDNSTPVAVIIASCLNYPDLTNDEIRNIPIIIQKENSTVKVFVVLNHQEEYIYLPDTLLIKNYYVSTEMASMALCNKCLPGWFPLTFVQTYFHISCYRMEVAPVNIDWLDASRTCKELNLDLATVESQEELELLQEQLFIYFLNNKEVIHVFNGPPSYSTVVYFGLKRDTATVAKRFQWTLRSGNRPLVVSHWLPDSPTGICSHVCGAWIFNGVLNYTFQYDHMLKNASAYSSIFSEYKHNNSEGWLNVGCGTKLSPLTLCEMSLLRHVDNVHRPANQDSYHAILNISNFREFKEAIVSVTAYASSKEFRTFLTDKNEAFPLFDCGEDADQPRYIAYSYVCDCTDHCSNRRDESYCVQIRHERCRSGHCIEYGARCDTFKDCDDGSDEENCETCLGIRCCDGVCLPPHLFNDGEKDCCECRTIDNVPLNDETDFLMQSSSENETCVFTCNKYICVYGAQLNDGHVDCTGLEGPLDETIGKLEHATSCYDISGIPFWAPKCVFLKDRYGSVLGCRDMSHLQNCKEFPCQEGYYKCPDRYCIPLHYVHDGNSDCPSGEEEIHIVNQSCIGNFACWNSKVCLHPDLVCDEHQDCPHKDDEENCDVSCADGFWCVAGTVTVERHTMVQLESLSFVDSNTRYLDMSGVNLSSVSNYTDDDIRFIYHLRLSGCSIKDGYVGLPSAQSYLLNANNLDLSYNLFTAINEWGYNFDEPYMFQKLNLSFNVNLNDVSIHGLLFLETIDLSYTGLSYLKETSFQDLPNLNHLNLSNTKLSVFHRHIFPASFTLQTLDLRGTPIVMFFQNTFNGLIIRSSLYADNFGLCCPLVRGSGVLGDMCHTSEDAISSCFDLIGIDVQRILLWLMAGIALFGNMVVILYRCIWDRTILKKGYGLFVLNLGIADLIMGIYLFVIAAADIYYRGVYVLYDKEWKASIICKMAGFLATLSSETSAFFIFLVTVDRYLTLKFPYGQNQFSALTKSAATISAWSISFMLALIPYLPIFGDQSVITYSAMCIGLLLTNRRHNGLGYSLGVAVVLNFIMFLLTAIGQLMIFRSMSENRMSMEATNQNSLRRAQDINVAKQLSLVVVSNFLCWFPVGFLGLLSLSGHEISNSVYAWTVVLVMPVNSAIDPFIYTIPFLLTKWKQFKYRTPKSQ